MTARTTVLVGSGKGGVGKSTVAVNLAVALAQKNLRVGLVDADLYGPSIPIMLGLRRLAPPRTDDPRDPKVKPIVKFGIKVISIGFFIEEARSVVWRGPALHATLQKMLRDVEWGELDVLIVDLPPGTGDVPMSLAQLLKVDGAVVVSTPQEVAMLDAIKAINAFHALDIPLLGVVENMAGYYVKETNSVHHIFGQGKAQELAARFHVPLLGSIPLVPGIRIGGDEGVPAALQAEMGTPFHALADTLLTYTQKLSVNPFQ